MAQTYIQPRHIKHDLPCIHAVSMLLYFSLSHYHCLPPTSPPPIPRSSKKGTVIVFGNQQSQCNHSITKWPQKWESGERVSQPQRQRHTHTQEKRKHQELYVMRVAMHSMDVHVRGSVQSEWTLPKADRNIWVSIRSWTGRRRIPREQGKGFKIHY